MSIVTKVPASNRVILSDVSWETYQSLARDLENRRSPRIAFDQGVLEIVTLSPEHERSNLLVAAIIEIALEEMEVEFEPLGSTTFKREPLQRSFEPDSCFYIRNVERIRNKKQLDLEVDPPPDLVVEIDLTSDSLDKLPLFASMGIPEVWRRDESLHILTLHRGRYVKQPASLAIPVLTVDVITELLASSAALKRLAWLRKTREVIRRRLSH